MLYSNTNIAAVLSLVLLAAASSSFAGDSPEEINSRIGSGDPVAGKEKSVLCKDCHGADGNSIAPNYPRLAGQYAYEIQRQIRNFQQGNRRDPKMTEVAMKLTDRRDLLDIAAYFASQKQMSGTPMKHEAGEKLYRDKGCLNCHGEIGKGKPSYNSLFPVIGGQHKEYLVKQMKDFKTGARDTDISGTMGELTNKMTDAEIEAVSAYLSGL